MKTTKHEHKTARQQITNDWHMSLMTRHRCSSHSTEMTQFNLCSIFESKRTYWRRTNNGDRSGYHAVLPIDATAQLSSFYGKLTACAIAFEKELREHQEKYTSATQYQEFGKSLGSWESAFRPSNRSASPCGIVGYDETVSRAAAKIFQMTPLKN